MEEIDNKTKECEDKLRRLGPSLPVDQKDRMQILYNMLMEYTEAFKNTMRGKYDVKYLYLLKNSLAYQAIQRNRRN